ncbi:MAG: hypothetical protein SP1CHLAM54_03390 [Chlamydiia bacterium]|nr:hypothetical protein [Chlamydiia bacterium]MCH9615255.1 hypothetical protein [Chlamydiia bacterium]MCH9628423.1 hypothetical protein [Chlamydiia bacterium]
MQSQGVVIGVDIKQEWLLPWFFNHYEQHNQLPVAIADFGMSKKARSWCEKKGHYFQLLPSNYQCPKEHICPEKRQQWEDDFGTGIWRLREAFLQKPKALLEGPFEQGIWIDIDCKVEGNIEPLLNCLTFGVELALAPDASENGEQVKHYSSGVIVYQKQAPILQAWLARIKKDDALFLGDQLYLSDVIENNEPLIFKMPSIYNWHRRAGENKDAMITHFGGGLGKIEIVKSLPESYFEELGLPYIQV